MRSLEEEGVVIYEAVRSLEEEGVVIYEAVRSLEEGGVVLYEEGGVVTRMSNNRSRSACKVWSVLS